jgi:uncharacterized protein (DUF697 family)/GTP-binding protein EngB required for normal cell division
MKKLASRFYRHVINPPSDEELKRAWQQSNLELPVIWLLGKTGAGKSSIVQQLTGHSLAEVGNGFMPCTQNSSYFDYPAQQPILRFLDTRGLGEVDYNADEDLESLGHRSHALLVVVRLRDAEQSAVHSALKKIRKSSRHIHSRAIIVVHTGADEISDQHDRERAMQAQQAALEKIWGDPVDACLVDFGERDDGYGLRDAGATELRELISGKVPELSLWLQKSVHQDAEQSNFEHLKTEVLWYAGSAAASDAIPLVGLVSVPAIQGKMLHSLAQKYDIEWSRRNFSEFTAAMGTSFALRYATSLGARQLAKMVPGFGQVVGGAFAVTVSYATTYALGRAACKYLYHKKTDTPLDDGSLQTVYQEAMAQGREVGKDVINAREQNGGEGPPPGGAP